MVHDKTYSETPGGDDRAILQRFSEELELATEELGGMANRSDLPTGLPGFEQVKYLKPLDQMSSRTLIDLVTPNLLLISTIVA